MTIKTIAMIGTGDMGHNVGRVLAEHGYQVITCLAGRSERSRRFVEQSGIEDVASLKTLAEQADLILSIIPPAAAIAVAEQMAQLFTTISNKPFYADCNAVSPMTSQQIAALMTVPYIDAGIIGNAPGKAQPPRFWVSGEQATIMSELDGKGIVIKQAGAEIGRASAIKMCYAAMNKGILALQTAVLTAAEGLQVSAELGWELEHSQTALYQRIKNSVPWLATDAERWIGEMEEIAATFAATGVTDKFHQGAADIYRLLAATPLAAETRENKDENRSLAETIAIFSQHSG